MPETSPQKRSVSRSPRRGDNAQKNLQNNNLPNGVKFKKEIGKLGQNPVFCQVTEFKGKMRVDIREYYTDNNGDLKPGRRGNSLDAEVYEKLSEIELDIADCLANKTEKKFVLSELKTKQKCVAVNAFKGKWGVDVRDYYNDNGDWKHGILNGAIIVTVYN